MSDPTKPDHETKTGQITLTINGADLPVEDHIRNDLEAELEAFVAAEIRNADPGFPNLPGSATISARSQFTDQ